MKSTEATLDGVPLLGEVVWALTSGPKHHEAVFSVRPEDLSLLLDGGLRPVDLVIDAQDGSPVGRWSNLFVLAEEPREDPNVARVLVVDRRWFWGSAHVSRLFNKRRVVGSKRTVEEGSLPELQPLQPIIAYHPATLKNGKPWTAGDVLKSVIDSCLIPERDLLGQSPAVRFESFLGGDNIGNGVNGAVGEALAGSSVPIEDMELEDSGENALARVLAYIPHARVKLDRFGDVVVYDETNLGDETLVRDSGPEMVGFGSTRVIANGRLRPGAINIYFRREHELRFDFNGDVAGRTVTQDERFFENVLPVPDAAGIELRDGVKVDQGTWVSFTDYFNAIGAPPFLSHLTGASQWQTAMRRFMVPYMDLWTGLHFAGKHDPDNDWMPRIGAIQQHWRKTWRISSRWMARLISIRAHLIATVHPSTGTRAPGKVWADHCWLATQRSIISYSGEFAGAPYCMNVKSYPTSGLLEDGSLAPALPVILDADQGIVHFEFRADPLGLHQTFIPGMVALGDKGSERRPTQAGPTSDISRTDLPIAFNAIGEGHDIPMLTSGYKVAMLISGSPATFNDVENRHLFKVEKKAEDVAKVLPAALRTGLGEAHGPALDIYVNPSVETARVDWRDADATAIEESIGVRPGPGSIRHLVVNLEGNAQGGASLDAIATALAAQTYALLADRYRGSKGSALQPGASPTGFLDRIEHVVTEEGAILSRMRFPDRLQPISLESLLPDSVRRIYMRLATMRGKDAA